VKKNLFLAILISRVLDPIFAFCLLFFYILFFEIGFGSGDFIKGLAFVVVEILVPVGWFVYLIRKGKIDYDITDKDKRGGFLFPVLVFLILMLPILVFLELDRLFLFFQVMAVVFVIAWLIINRFYKISGHIGSLTIVLLIFARLFNISYYWFLLVVILAWSRVRLKKHTWGQVVAGFVVALILGNVILLAGGY